MTATLVFHGKPPFHVYLRQQRNKEPAREMSRTFQGFRGEITIQPETSGTYAYSFTSLSDANYKRVPLDGPTITQSVHPPAAAFFVTPEGGKNVLNVCSGNTVEVDVELRVRYAYMHSQSTNQCT